MHWEMENEEPNPVKLINRTCLDIKSYNCLIYGKWAGKQILRDLREKGIWGFAAALGIKGDWNNFNKISCDDVFNFNNNSLKNNEVSKK